MGNFIVGMAVGIALSVFGMGKIVDTVEAFVDGSKRVIQESIACLLYTSPSPRDLSTSRMPSSA